MSGLSTTYSQQTKDGLAKLVGEEQAAMLCNIRSAGRAVTRDEIVVAYRILFDAIRATVEK